MTPTWRFQNKDGGVIVRFHEKFLERIFPSRTPGERRKGTKII